VQKGSESQTKQKQSVGGYIRMPPGFMGERDRKLQTQTNKKLSSSNVDNVQGKGKQ
jgi:hypothetical protein